MRDFAQDEISPIARKIDESARVPAELLRKLPELGLLGINIPTQYAGAGADYLSLLLAVEELSRLSGTIGARVSFHGIVCGALSQSKNENLKSALLPKLAAATLSAFSIDPKSTIGLRKINDSEIVLDGSSDYVLNADSAGVFLVLARAKDESQVLVCFSKEGMEDHIEIGEPVSLMGMRGTGTCQVSIRGLKLTKESLVSEPAETPTALLNLLIAGRLAVAAQALGVGQAAHDEEIKYANERSQFNTKIGRFYAVREFIASDAISLDSARSLTYDATFAINRKSASKKSATAKVAASNAAVQTARHSIRVHGGYGFIRDYPVERYLRDARVTQIYLEPNEALKAKIAEDLLSG